MCSSCLTTTLVMEPASSFSVCLKAWQLDGYLVGLLFSSNLTLDLNQIVSVTEDRFKKKDRRLRSAASH